MSSEIIAKALGVIGPAEGRIHAQTLTATTSTPIDVAGTVIGAFVSNGQNFLSLICDQDLYYKFSTSGSATVDNTVGTAGALLGAKQETRVQVPRPVVGGSVYRYLIVWAASTAALRMWTSSF
jgi:hypothetical protein